MQFRLVYEGPLKSHRSARPRHLMEIRRVFHSQLRELWRQPPLEDQACHLLQPVTDSGTGIVSEVGDFLFAPLVNSKHSLVAEVDLLFLRPGEPGRITTHGGDLDNRVKTLFDCLRMPHPNENQIPPGECPQEGEKPFFCLLEDDALVTSFSVTSDRLLKAGLANTSKQTSDVLVVISVTTRQVGSATWMGLLL
jgi:hypothetical protein